MLLRDLRLFRKTLLLRFCFFIRLEPPRPNIPRPNTPLEAPELELAGGAGGGGAGAGAGAPFAGGGADILDYPNILFERRRKSEALSAYILIPLEKCPSSVIISRSFSLPVFCFPRKASIHFTDSYA